MKFEKKKKKVKQLKCYSQLLQFFCQSYVNANIYPACDVEYIFCTSRLANMPMNIITVHDKLLWKLCTISLTIHDY